MRQPDKKTGRFPWKNDDKGNERRAHQIGRLGFEQIIEGMKTYTAEQITDALKAAGFSKVKADHHRNKPWITVLARK